MARGINKVILVGNLGNDPDVKATQGGTTITTISVATSEQWKDKQTGQAQERTEWHRVKFFGRLAEIAGDYLKKGSQVYIEGSLRTDKYTDKNGVERYSTDIIANEMQMLGGRGGGEGGQGGAAPVIFRQYAHDVDFPRAGAGCLQRRESDCLPFPHSGEKRHVSAVVDVLLRAVRQAEPIRQRMEDVRGNLCLFCRIFHADDADRRHTHLTSTASTRRDAW